MTKTIVLGKLSPEAQVVLDTAVELAAKLRDDAAHSGHLLFALMQVHPATRQILAFAEFNLPDWALFAQLVKGRAHPELEILEGDIQPAPMAPSIDLVLRGAVYIQEHQGDEALDPEHLLLGMLATRVHRGVLLLERAFGLDMPRLVRAAVAVINGYRGDSLEGIEPWVATSGTFDAMMSLEELVRGRWTVDD